MATGCLAGQIFKVQRSPGALGEIDDDAQCERVAADVGDEFTEQVGRSVQVLGGRTPDHFDVVAFPVRLSAGDGVRRPPGDGLEISDGDGERGIGDERQPQCRTGSIEVRRPLRVSVPEGCLPAGSKSATVVVCGRPESAWAKKRLTSTGPVHGCQDAPYT